MGAWTTQPPSALPILSSAGSLWALARPLTALVNRVLPGKRNAAVLLVANQRTAAALPAGYRGRMVELVENGVDLETWHAAAARPRAESHFAFMGRLVDWKALPIVFEAMTRVPGATLDVIGDGAMRQSWQQEVARLGLSGRVCFLGWQSQQECALALADATALVLPSLYECGGAVVLEAMAMARPVIATAWGGPSRLSRQRHRIPHPARQPSSPGDRLCRRHAAPHRRSAIDGADGSGRAKEAARPFHLADEDRPHARYLQVCRRIRAYQLLSIGHRK
jgi:Glycosyl transferases group 1